MEVERGVQSVARAFSVLTVLADEPGSPLGRLSQLAALHPATARRLLQTLQGLGYVYQARNTRRYYLGPALMYLGRSAASQFPFREAAHAEMEALVARCHETAYIAVLQDGDVYYVDVVESSQTIRLSTEVGDRCPAYSTATGRVLLASLPSSQLDQYLDRHFDKQTSTTVTDPTELRRLIEQVRTDGVSIVVDEQEVGVTSVAAAICGSEGRPLAALAIAGPTYRMRDRAAELGDIAIEWGRRLGHTIVQTPDNTSGSTPFR